MQQDDHVGILLKRARLTQVANCWHLVSTLLGCTVELRQRDDRHVEFFRQQLQRTRELAHLLLAALDPLAARHELQVVDDDEAQVVPLLQSPALRADLHERHVGRVVDEQRGLAHDAHFRHELRPVRVAHRA